MKYIIALTAVNYLVLNVKSPFPIHVRQKFLKQLCCMYFSSKIINHALCISLDQPKTIQPYQTETLNEFLKYLFCDALTLLSFPKLRDPGMLFHHALAFFITCAYKPCYTELPSGYYMIGFFELFSVLSGFEAYFKYKKLSQLPALKYIRMYKLFINLYCRIPYVLYLIMTIRMPYKLLALTFLMYDANVTKKLIRLVRN